MRIPARFLAFRGAFLVLALVAFATSAFGQAWSRVTWPDADWSQVVSSADGTKLVAAALFSGTNFDTSGYPPPGALLFSTNAGRTWTQSSLPKSYWIGVACSADGNTVIAASEQNLFGLPGPMYTSTNSGSTWTMITNGVITLASGFIGFGELSAVACSGNGRLLVAATGIDDGYIFTSKDGGPWTTTSAPDELWLSVAVSANGSRLLAMNEPSPPYAAGPYWISTNSGGSWAPTVEPSGFTVLATSADGSLSVAAIYQTNQPGGIYISTNSWVTSTLVAVGTEGGYWSALASLAEGGRLRAFAIDGGIYLTMGTGTAWTLVAAPNKNWYSVASAADGSKVAAVVNPYSPTSLNKFGLYTWPSTPTLSLSQPPSTNTLLLSWPVSLPSLGLQQSSDLISTNWTSITNVATMTNGLLQAMVPTSTGRMFYRLKSQ